MKNLILIVSIPTFLYENFKILYFDIVIKFITFPFTDYLHNYSGIIEVRKKYELNTLEVNNLDTDRFGFKATKFGLHIEKISIPPEDAENEGCGNSELF